MPFHAFQPERIAAQTLAFAYLELGPFGGEDLGIPECAIPGVNSQVPAGPRIDYLFIGFCLDTGFGELRPFGHGDIIVPVCASPGFNVRTDLFNDVGL